MSNKNDLFKKTSHYTGSIIAIDDTEGEVFWIKPSDIIGNSTSKFERFQCFVSSFGSCERETSAYRICQYFKEHGDRWFPVDLREIDNYVKSYENDFFISAKSFIEDGWNNAQLIGKKIVFTSRFIERCAGFRKEDELEASKAKNVFELN
jgi:hypothetical protein